ncbi:MAG TPA: SMC-Scp complex subunit ScpB [Thermomicrobiales bacterium]|jgi:segregation and condensation protein B|nr:SMC-Scp complex subunit ScpB [Chloroflexota bacterium]HQX62713.1 SMC-Scp complex subunit ScpB [Thermomicrobiales bacterium]HQZ88524.1 SMC-Scp complex subunit ScpB [Thermomicrobiales bacterium]HRA30362.1 SMC-Scp complex subunit ScpB [Thermomicrobiales bacterium]
MVDADRQLSLEIVPIEEAVPALEALLFASGGSEDVPTLAAALEWGQSDVRRALSALEEELRAHPRGIALQRNGDRVQLVTVARYGRAIERLLGIERQVKLSSAALETLAIVAYRQPVIRPEIEAIRGVDSSGVLATLVARELVEARGRRPGPGNPVEYGTTGAFLRFFGMTSLEDLPPLEEALAGDTTGISL